MELAITIAVIGLALAFAAWRVLATLRISRGAKGGGCGGCGTCAPSTQPETPARN